MRLQYRVDEDGDGHPIATKGSCQEAGAQGRGKFSAHLPWGFEDLCTDLIVGYLQGRDGLGAI